MVRSSLVVRRILAWLVMGVVTSCGVADGLAWGDEGFPPHPEKRKPDDIKPLPLVPIPDDPPPHEGAMIDIPYTIQPPDILLVEVLEANPGRPISGERLVRPDGTITLGFYGDLHVRGLTPAQAKEKLILHLRSFLPDDSLGLFRFPRFLNITPVMPKLPPAPAPDPKPATSSTSVRRPAVRSSTRRNPRRPIVQPLPAPATPDADVLPPGAAQRAPDAPEEPLIDASQVQIVAVKDSDRVFVDVMAYNSTNYYVTGDVAAPGRMPTTGNETVLDGLNHGGGLLPTADPKNIALVRPARAGKPARVYRVDYDAIVNKGDSRTNYQLFHGDRVVVGRLAIVERTTENDRLSAQLQTILSSIRQADAVAGRVARGAELTTAQREAFLKEWIDFWVKNQNRDERAPLDQKALREILTRSLIPHVQEPPKPKD